MSAGNMLSYNLKDGFLEAIVRGHRNGILKAADYANLTQCDSVDDMKMHLSLTDYGNFLQNEPSPIPPSVIAEKATEKLVQDFEYLQKNCVEPLYTFLEYIRYGYMIDNAILLITGTLHGRDTGELIEKCHPLGLFDNMATLCAATTVRDLYQLVIVDTPLAPYFTDCLSSDDLDELNIEIIRNTIYKAYLEDFLEYCKKMGNGTDEVMSEIIAFEADRRAINITMNSFGTDITRDEREKLLPILGRLYPEGITKLVRADDQEAVKAALEPYNEYRQMVNDSSYGEKSLEDAFFEYETKLNRLSFEKQFHYGIFYSWIKLKEQEIRNLVWIAECISQDQKHRMNQFVQIF